MFSCSNKNDKKQEDFIVKEYKLILDKNELAEIYKDYKKDIYIPVTVILNGDTAKAKMRLRGDSSRGYDKKSLKIVFKKDSLLKGEKRKINLNSEWTDKTYLRQYVSSLLMQRAGINSFKSNFAAIYINDEFYGLYLQVENVDNKFLTDRSLDKKGNLYKATKDGACMSMFEYENPEVKWEKKTNKKDGSFSDLQKLIYDINNIPDYEFQEYLKSNFEYDKLITIVALNMLIKNGSTYYHNYYLYHDINGNGKWQMFPWDIDKSLNHYNWEPYDFQKSSSNWESDNPLIERMLIDDNIFEDIKQKVTELHKDVFSENSLLNLFSTIESKIEKYVILDQTDKIKNIDKWKIALESEREYVKIRYEELTNQLNTYPRGFKIKNTKKSYTYGLSPNFRWNTCVSPQGKEIKYTLKYGPDFLLEDTITTRIISEIKNTNFTINEVLPRGKYYWRVYASDGTTEIEGYNTKTIFNVIDRQNTLQDIVEDTLLSRTNSPYYIEKDISVKENITLTIEQGVEIIFTKDANLYVHGDVKMLGTKYSPILLNPENTEWGSVYIINKEGNSKFNYVVYNNGAFRSKHAEVELNNVTFNAQNKTLVVGEERHSLVWVHKGKFTFRNCQVYGAGKGECLNINYAETIVEHSYFENFPDAIEIMDVSKGFIRNNFVVESPDDAIDMNSCSNIIVENNLLLNNNDKGISVGTEQYGPSTNILIQNNIIINNKIGISIKDSSFAVVRNNVFIGNKVDLEAKIKNNWKKYELGGNLKVDSCFFINTREELLKFDKISKISIKNSISNKFEIQGENNNLQEDINIKEEVLKKYNNIKYRTYNILDFYNYE